MRVKLTNENKNLLREKLGNTVQFDNLDDYLDLNCENFIFTIVDIADTVVEVSYASEVI
ncbi:hypothetical protein CCY16_00380 [Wolbachia endosymbiont of Wuchereria bancrofti]|nr:hypothetical protein CCY16_00380 [Wolbachia endosymbiont of Wuchereria bancrofti]